MFKKYINVKKLKQCNDDNIPIGGNGAGADPGNGAGAPGNGAAPGKGAGAPKSYT